ncbi:MAG: hypothetical protein K1X88_25860 [Nannocystaceae bacterium]|nr:hypothetical protein [Nannocystaceae bacterium]
MRRALLLGLAAALGCGDDAAGDGGGSSSSGAQTSTSGPGTTATTATATTAPGGTGSSSSSSGADSSSSGAGSSESSGGTTGDIDVPDVLCNAAPPDDAELPPPPPPYTGGTCPQLVPGVNALPSTGHDREFIVVVPQDLQPGESLPLVFLWHWLGGDANAFLEKADVQNAANQLRFAAAIPSERGDLLFRWPFTTIDSDGRMQEEFAFFDDMLACMTESFAINTSCVSSVGVSAGALFTDQLGSARGEYLASIVSLSGGVGGFVRPWSGSPHIMPAMVLWGGPSDFCVAIDFEAGSHNLESALVDAGHPVLECIHNCGHSEPPFEPPSPELTKYIGMWRFWLDHPYWLADGETPWSEGLPEGTPQWCSLGVGTATPREGPCEGGGC